MMLRSALIFIVFLSALVSRLHVFAGSTTTDDCFSRIDQELGAKLSPKASIVHYSSAAPRWSTYHAPQPGTIVNVAEENDVVETLKYCIENNLDFLVQSGGHGWATTFNIHKKDVLINMRGLNQVHVSDSKDTVTFEGGALVGEVLEATYQNQVEAALPTCPCVGMSGAALGGGYNRLIGQYGLVIDNVVSMNFITADGELMTVTPTSSPDLWWALRGAGANFGIVTSVTMKAYPPINNGIGWIGNLVFSPDKLEDLVQTLSDFCYTKEMFAWLFLRPLLPDYNPGIVVSLWYTGSEAEAKAAFKPFYDLGPESSTSEEVPYNQFNYEFGTNCDKGPRRPAYGASLKKLDPTAFRQIWNEYVSIISQYPELIRMAFAIEAFSPEKVREFSDNSSAFPHRDVNFQALLSMVYEDADLDPVAENFGERIRELWRNSSGFEEPQVYINYGIGDEDIESIYGDSLPRLKELKKCWDKHGRFSQFFPIPL